MKTISSYFFAALVIWGVTIVNGCGEGGSPVPSSAKAITAFSFTSSFTFGTIGGTPTTILTTDATGTIDETAKTISVIFQNKTYTALVATFTTTGTKVTVNGVVQTSGKTANDFTTPVAYVVTAEDGTTATYTVSVKRPLEITSFSIVNPTPDSSSHHPSTQMQKPFQ